MGFFSQEIANGRTPDVCRTFDIATRRKLVNSPIGHDRFLICRSVISHYNLVLDISCLQERQQLLYQHHTSAVVGRYEYGEALHE